MSTSVEPTVRPRSDMPLAPDANARANPVDNVPLLFAVRLRSTSETLVKPCWIICSLVMTWTSLGVSASARRMLVPVTVIRSIGVVPICARAGVAVKPENAPAAISCATARGSALCFTFGDMRVLPVITACSRCCRLIGRVPIGRVGRDGYLRACVRRLRSADHPDQPKKSLDTGGLEWTGSLTLRTLPQQESHSQQNVSFDHDI